MKKENKSQVFPKLDLTNVTITIPDQPSRKAEIIHQFTVLLKHRELGTKKEDFNAEYEREIIERYEELTAQEKEECFEQLKKEFQEL